MNLLNFQLSLQEIFSTMNLMYEHISSQLYVQIRLK